MTAYACLFNNFVSELNSPRSIKLDVLLVVVTQLCPLLLPFI